MVHAFIMVKTAAGASGEVVEAARDVAGVGEAHVVAGDFDVIVELDADEVYDVLHAASSTVQGFDGVAETKTYISLD